MVIGITIFFFTYVCFVILLIIGWRRISRPRPFTATQDHRITVVIPVRNEACNLEALLCDLSHQQYRSFEVIVVDDHSTDETVQVATAFLMENIGFRVISSKGEGKKRALTTGIEAASGQIIVTTDGDCRVSPGWLAAFNLSFQNPHVVMTFGGVGIMQERRIFDKMQAIEMASLIGSGASALAWGYPLFCSGANLAFRKTAFDAVAGYAGNFSVASGDDEFLMRKVFAKYPEGLAFAAAPDSVVRTRPSHSVKSFFQQRVRWAGKWRHNNSLYTKVVAVYIFLVQLTVASALVFVFSGDRSLQQASVTILAARFIAELFFLYPVTRFLGTRWNWPGYVVLQLIYPWYVAATALISAVLRGSWKGRKI